MTTLTVTVADRASVSARAARALSGKVQGAHLSFASAALLWKILGPKRWDILKAMTGAGPMTVRGVARAVGRDVKAVHGDVRMLVKSGILDRDDRGHVQFPYDSIHVDFKLKAA